MPCSRQAGDQRSAGGNEWGVLTPFPQFLAPGATGYLLGEVEPSDFYDAKSFHSARIALAYDYVASIPDEAGATVLTTKARAFDYRYKATGTFSGSTATPSYLVVTLALDECGEDPRQRAHWAPSA